MRNKEKIERKEKGFTLAEVVISGVILTILAFGLMPTISNAKKAQVGLHERVIGASILDREMNRLRIQGSKNIPLAIPDKILVKDIDGIDGTLTYNIQPDLANADDKYIYLDLTWAGDGGHHHKESLTTFMFQE